MLHKLRPDQQCDWVSVPVCVKIPIGSFYPRPLNRYLVHPVQNTDRIEDVL